MDGEITAKITCGLCGVEMQDCEHRGVGQSRKAYQQDWWHKLPNEFRPCQNPEYKTIPEESNERF